MNIVPGRGEGRGKSTIIHCHYKSYEGGLKNEVSVIVPTNFGEDCSIIFLYLNIVLSSKQGLFCATESTVPLDPKARIRVH